MKLKLAKGFQTVQTGGKTYLTSSVRGFNGQIACNETAAFIVKKLHRRTSREKIIKSVCRSFDASEAEVTADVDDVLALLRQVGALVD